MKARVGLIGARGYVGQELTALIDRHHRLEVALAASQRDGLHPGDIAARDLDVYVLALPNGASQSYVDAICTRCPRAVIVDLSADHRFDADWAYGQPERRRHHIRAATRIANPGCYATAAQLAIAPLVSELEGAPSVFGVSGFSGAGTTPSEKNDPERLRGNLLPYSLTGHVHEREIGVQLGCSVFFMPHVAEFFRGLTVTVSVPLRRSLSLFEVRQAFDAFYSNEPLVSLSDAPPLVRDAVGTHGVHIGGFAVDSDRRHAVIVATIDNLLGGAASQALRNINLALGYQENEGILP